jgi:hypothetical protein
MSVSTFVAVVSAIFRLKRAWDRTSQERRHAQDIVISLPPPPEALNTEQLEAAALRHVWAERQVLQAENASVEDWMNRLFAPDATSPFDRAGNVSSKDIGDAIDYTLATWRAATPPPVAETGDRLGLTPGQAYTLRNWTGHGSAKTRYARLVITLADTLFDVVAANPQVLGLDKKGERIVAALATNLSDVIGNDDDIAQGQFENFGERAFRIFLESTLETAVEQPDLIDDQPHVAALLKAVLEPLHEEVKQNRTREWVALDRLKELLRGPVAHAALRIMQEHKDEFLKGEFADDEILGAVTRTIIGQLVATDGFNIETVFSRSGVLLVYRAALRTATERPELFINGQGGPTDRARAFLSGVARVLEGAPYPYRAQDGLAAQIAVVALDVAQTYVAHRFVEATGDSDWSKAGMDAAEEVVATILEGLKAGLIDPDRTANPMGRIFTRSQAVEILQILAHHIMERPAMITGPRGSAHTRTMVTAFAQMISADETGLLRAQDWRRLLSRFLTLCAENPAALIRVDPAAGPHEHVSVALVRTLLQHAAADLSSGRPRLFGARLASMIDATLTAVATNVLTALDEPRQAAHLEAFTNFLTQLSVTAVGEDRSLRMSAADVAHVYAWFIAKVIEDGGEITPEELAPIIRDARRHVDVLAEPAVDPAARPEDDVAPGDDTDPARPESPVAAPEPSPENRP